MYNFKNILSRNQIGLLLSRKALIESSTSFAAKKIFKLNLILKLDFNLLIYSLILTLTIFIYNDEIELKDTICQYQELISQMIP